MKLYLSMIGNYGNLIVMLDVPWHMHTIDGHSSPNFKEIL